MKYHDSIEKANQVMTLSVKQLKQWQLAINPINYAVCYEYIKNTNTVLVESINRQQLLKQKLSNFFMEELYKEHVLNQSKFRDNIIADLDSILGAVQNNYVKSSSSAKGLITQLDSHIPELLSLDKSKVKSAIGQLQKASSVFKKQQQQLAEQLAIAQVQTQTLQEELEEARKEIYLDPVTGMYNKKGMAQHIDTWLADDAEKQIAAIVVSVDHFPQFTQRFGSLIGDVILSKIAKKVNSYVNTSGFPVRTSDDEFIILLPDVDGGIVQEIANKIKHGVEKLRFVSVQSGVRLPKMSVSLGVSEMNRKEPVNQFIKRTRKTITPNS